MYAIRSYYDFEIRKNLLKYDDVMNDQRKVVYEQRKDLMQSDDVSETIEAMRECTPSVRP